MSEMEPIPEGFVHPAGARVGRIVGMAPGDDRMSSLVALTFTLSERPTEPARFTLRADDADILAEALADSARKAREEGAL